LLTGVLDLDGTAVGVSGREGLEREREVGREEEGDDCAFLSVAALRNSEASAEPREPLPERMGGRCIVWMKTKAIK